MSIGQIENEGAHNAARKSDWHSMKSLYDLAERVLVPW